MEKNLKKIRTVALILLITLIALIAFAGVFGKSLNQFKNIIPDYTYGMELNGTRELKFVVDTSEEEKEVYVDDDGNILGEVKDSSSNSNVSLSTDNSSETTETEKTELSYAKETRKIKKNDDSVLTKDNYEKTKKVIQNRFNKQGISEYDIRLDNVTGAIVVDVPDSSDINSIYELVQTKGNIQIIDNQTGIVLIDGKNVKKVEAVYSSSASEGYRTMLQITFDQTGADKLKEISNQYVEVKDEEGNSTKTYVQISLDGQTMLTTYFGEELNDGIIQIPVGDTTKDVSEFKNLYTTAQFMATIMNDGQTPVVYKLNSDNFIKSEFTEQDIIIAKVALVVILVLVTVIFSIKFKLNGLLAGIANIGFVALTSLILRYTKVTITINSVISFVTMIILNIVFMKMLLKALMEKSSSEALNKTMIKYYLSIIPVGVVAVIFTFMSNITVGSVGMLIFWCLFIQVIYNFIVVKALYLGRGSKN